MADERNLVDEEDAVKENSTKNRREKKSRKERDRGTAGKTACRKTGAGRMAI